MKRAFSVMNCAILIAATASLLGGYRTSVSLAEQVATAAFLTGPVPGKLLITVSLFIALFMTYLVARAFCCSAGSRIEPASRQQKWSRVLAASMALAGTPAYISCGLNHVCMCGHVAHGWSQAGTIADAFWLLCFSGACIMALRSDAPLRRSFAIILLVFPLSRINLGSRGGVLFLVEGPLLLITVLISLAAFRGRRVRAPLPA